MDRIAIGIIGVGKIAVDQHIPALRASPAFTIGATSNLTPVSVAGEERDVADYRDLLAMRDIDAVAIATPPQVRYRIAREAIAAGKHVLIEKPPAGSLAELFDLAALAQAAGVTLFTAWHSQYNAAVEAAADALAMRTVTRLRITWKEDVRHWHPGQTWIWRAGGFGVFDPGINALSIVTRILPRPVFVAAADLEFPSNCDAPIGAELTFASADGPAGADLGAIFDFRQTGLQTWDIEIGTADGLALRLSAGGTTLVIDDQPIELSPSAEYPAIYDRFAQLIVTRTSLVDCAPFVLVADAFMLGRRRTVEPFHE